LTEGKAMKNLKSLDNREFRFLAVGGFNTVFNWAIFVLFQLIYGKSGYMYSLLSMYVVGSIVGFWLYRKFVFRVSGNLWRDLAGYQLVSIGPFIANLIVLPGLVNLLKITPVIAQTIFVILNTIWSYLGHRFISFRRKRDL
jgi:putative flippase GtrA